MSEEKQLPELEADEKALGMNVPITRRDFVNTTLIGIGGALLGAASPLSVFAETRPQLLRIEKDAWWGYGAVGDYARSSGNTREVAEAAHRIRDRHYNTVPPDAIDTGETYDMVIVGGGMSGLGAAHFFKKNARAGQTALLLENHGIFGGEAKRNEFVVDGQLLMAPQGSNDFGVPAAGSGTVSDRMFEELRIPREFEFQEWDRSRTPLRFARDNYANMAGVAESKVDIGYYFDGKGPFLNIWRDDLRNAPFPEATKAELLKWRYTQGENTPEFRAMLDTMTYKQYIENVLKFSPAVTKYIEPVIGLINGASPDAVSAFAASQIGMPAVARGRGRDPELPLSFPGGTEGFTRYFAKDLIPNSIEGGHNFNDVMNGKVRFDELDRAGNPVRMRVGATAVHVQHDAPPERAQHVLVTYEQGGKVYRVRARGVVMASGAWVNQHIIKDLPEDMRAAYEHFHHSPALIANVALTNWRFLYKLGITAAEWHGSNLFGFSANIRQPMIVGDYRQPFDPDKPTVLTFYTGVYTPGLSVYEQGVQGRHRMFSTTFYEYERQIREQMVRQFGAAGFDPERDIAGIILNRWGHARLVQQPGYYHGANGQPSPREAIERGFGRLVIGHSELNGHQSVTGGVAQGYRAAEQIMNNPRW